MYSFFQFNDAHHHFLVDDTVDDANREGDRSSSCMKTLFVQAQLCTVHVRRRCTYSCSVTNAGTKACAGFRRTLLLARILNQKVASEQRATQQHRASLLSVLR